jgi:hypothetical protein
MFSFLRPVLFPSGRPSPSLDAAAVAALADARDEALIDADAALTPERAQAQRDAILARLRASASGGATDDGRVLAFPPREADGMAPVRRPAHAGVLGWALTAAAAGIVVGAGAGTGTYPELAPAPIVERAAAAAAPAVERAAIVTMPEPDDEMLAALDAALSTRGVEELQPLDALTPRVTLVAAR